MLKVILSTTAAQLPRQEYHFLLANQVFPEWHLKDMSVVLTILHSIIVKVLWAIAICPRGIRIFSVYGQ